MNTNTNTNNNTDMLNKVNDCIDLAKSTDFYRWGNHYIGCLDITFNNGKREDEFPVHWIKEVRQLDGWDTDVRDWFTGDYLVEEDGKEKDRENWEAGITRDEYFLVNNSYYLVIYDNDLTSRDTFVISLADIKSIECKAVMIEEWE
jgi:hypothetical protein